MQGLRTLAVITAVGVMLSAQSVLAKSGNTTAKPAARAKAAVSRTAQEARKFLSFEEHLKLKVAAGEITQEEADQQLAAREAKVAEMKTKAKEKVAEMLANGKITQQQADKMLAAIDQGKPMGGMGQKGAPDRKTFEERLTDKVTAGTITQEEADKLLADHNAKLAEGKQKAKDNVAKRLADGKITQEQADKMLSAIDEGKLPMGGMGKQVFKGERKNIEEIVAEKVKAGTITQEEADKILADHAARLAAAKEKAKDKVADMLANGKITQEQADKMLSAIDQGKLPFGRMGGIAPMHKAADTATETATDA